MCETTQAISRQMDKVPQQLAFVHSELQEEMQWAVDQAIFELKSQILMEVDKEFTTLETCMEVKYNEVRQETAFTLKEINESVVVV